MNVAAAYPPYGEPPLPHPHSSHAEIPGQDSANEPDYVLETRQQPHHARVAIGKEKDRKPVDPPPIIQLKVSAKKDPMQNYLQSPYYFMTCTLVKSESSQDDPPNNALVGTLVSSLHRLKDTDNQDGGFFVFGDLSVKQEGRYKLRFTLYKMRGNECGQLASTTSDVFEVFAAKAFPGLQESTFLTRSFSDQGVRLRLRKDSRAVSTRKRNASSAEFVRKHSSHDREQVMRQGMGRASSGDDSLGGYGHQGGSAYDQGNYGYDMNGMNKRQRLDSGGGGHGGGGGGHHGYGPPPDMQGYPRAYHPQIPPQIPVTTGPYSMPSQPPPTAPSPMSYGPPPLGRLDTQHLGGPMAPTSNSAGGPSYHSPPIGAMPPSATNSAAATYPSPSTRHSPHGFGGYAGIQASPTVSYPPPVTNTMTSAHPVTDSPITYLSQS